MYLLFIDWYLLSLLNENSLWKSFPAVFELILILLQIWSDSGSGPVATDAGMKLRHKHTFLLPSHDLQYFSRGVLVQVSSLSLFLHLLPSCDFLPLLSRRARSLLLLRGGVADSILTLWLWWFGPFKELTCALRLPVTNSRSLCKYSQ